MIAHGDNCRKISEKLDITYFTARKHRANIISKLNFQSAAELDVFAVMTINTAPITDPNYQGDGRF
ncbi:MAG: hypothetical protein JJ858_04060 [Rhizobiaceae bacterium]|nr:hypothetical protein [Rhizobiaceae bacterium]